jgi:hypothetical protein
MYAIPGGYVMPADLGKLSVVGHVCAYSLQNIASLDSSDKIW